MDPGHLLIRALQRLGLAWDVKTPGSEAERDGLVRVGSKDGRVPRAPRREAAT
jgi:hypothetical protein